MSLVLVALIHFYAQQLIGHTLPLLCFRGRKTAVYIEYGTDWMVPATRLDIHTPGWNNIYSLDEGKPALLRHVHSRSVLLAIGIRLIC
jgi:hypothetical protein